MIVYTQYLSPRVEYIFSTLLTAAGVDYFSIISDKKAFQDSSEEKINYSSEAITTSEIWIRPVSILFEKVIKNQEIICFNFNRNKAFFKTDSSDFPFDIFAASFYLLTRYEEYLPHDTDMYGRYAHQNSLAYKQDFLRLPLINLWLQSFCKIIGEKFPALQLTPKPFSFLPTYDIDIAYSYLNKGIRRNLGGFARSMWASEWALVSERMKVLFGKQADPFDSFKWLNQLHDDYHLQPIFFFLLAHQNKDYDKNILPGKKAIKELLKTHAENYDVAIHPSWQSGDKKELLLKEIKTLEKFSGKQVTKSRQHYIRMSLPETYERLIDAGITQDYSLGYGSINGFRASYCLPYYWYNLKKEQTTNLTIYPFCFMDANSYYEQHCNSEEALSEMQYYFDTVKNVNGLFITIWHNHFVGTDKMFSGWKESYKTFVDRNNHFLIK